MKSGARSAKPSTRRKEKVIYEIRTLVTQNCRIFNCELVDDLAKIFKCCNIFDYEFFPVRGALVTELAALLRETEYI